MMRIGKALGWGIGCAMVCAGVWAAAASTPTNPYEPIVARNVFALKPQPPPPPPPEPPKPPAPQLKLNGITTIMGHKQALITAQIPAKGGEPAKQEALILGEDQMQSDIHVLEIDLKAWTVKVDNAGTVMTLAMEKTDSHSSGAPGAGIMQPQQPPPPMPSAFVPAPNPVAQPGAGITPAGGGLGKLPIRQLRMDLPSGAGAAPVAPKTAP